MFIEIAITIYDKNLSNLHLNDIMYWIILVCNDFGFKPFEIWKTVLRYLVRFVE